MASERPLRLGVVGLGSGAITLLGGIKKSRRIQVVAAADVRQEALDAFAKEFQAETFHSIEEMCESPHVEAVCIVTPTHLHKEHVITAAEHGKHIMVTKPMAITLEDCAAMNAAAERNRVVLICGHTQSMLLPIRKMAELVHSGELGKLAMVHTWHFTDWIYRPRMPFELDVATGGGVVFRQSPHQIDIVRLIGGGMVKSVRAQVMQLDPSRPAPGAYVVFLEFAGGVPATLIYNGYGHFDAAEITFGRSYRPSQTSRPAAPEEEAALKEAGRYRGSEAIESRRAEATEEPPFSAFGLTLASCERADVRQSPHGLWVYNRDGREERVLPPDEARGEAEFEELYQAVLNNRAPIHSGRWGEATHEVTLAIMESARDGKEIVLSHQVALPA